MTSLPDLGLNYHILWDFSGCTSGKEPTCQCRVYGACVLSRFSCVQLFATLWIVACQAPLSIGFFRQEYWSGLPFPSSGDLPNPGIQPRSLKSPALATKFLPLVPPGYPLLI